MKKQSNDLFPLIHSFLTDYLPVKRNCSPNTIKAYRTAIDQLIDFAKEKTGYPLLRIDLQTLDIELISAYLDQLENQKHCSVKTRNYRLQCLRAFYGYIAMTDNALAVYQVNICKIPIKETAKNVAPEYLSEDAIKALLAQPNISTDKGIRNQFFMVLMYDTAGRIQEIIDTKLSDFRLDGTPQLKLHGKGDKYRSVPLTPETVQHLMRYKNTVYPDEPFHSDEPLFFTVRNGRKCKLSDDMVRVFMSQYAKQAQSICTSMPEKIHPHLLRHSRAMHLYQHGMDLTLLSQWLGHSSISTTLIYAYADTEMKRKAIEAATDRETFPTVSGKTSPYDVNDEDILKRLYGLKV